MSTEDRAVVPATQDQANEALSTAVGNLRFDAQAVGEKTRRIHLRMLAESRHIKDGDFKTIATPDLSCLFDLYESEFFGGLLKKRLEEGGTPLFFKLSARLTRAGARTSRFQRRDTGATHYEIAVSTTLLFQTFADVHRTVRVNGLVCQDRLEALQRLFEHELVHLVEMLVWGKSSCTAPNFKALAGHLFAHSDTTHDLVTQHERAHTAYDLREGEAVEFTFEGRQYRGIVNRITRRATVLVPDPRGVRYKDGTRYLKFYIPLNLLKKLQPHAPPS